MVKQTTPQYLTKRRSGITLRCLITLLCCAVIASCKNGVDNKPATDELVNYPEKKEMILLTDRAPQLETPLKVFREDFTPNDRFFVRWHLSQLLTKINIDTFKLYINGSVDKPLALSLNDLKTKFPQDSIVALAICAGNSRSTFNPKVPGSQWKNGAMGNAKWKGVRLKDILAMAGVKKDAIDVSFQGMDKGALPGIPAFVKSLDVNQCLGDDVMIAYEMNGEPIPMLNGYPLKLVVPGWYATYWVGALNSINVLSAKFGGFWMEKAYRIADNTQLSEKPDSLSKTTVPLTKIYMHSIIVEPEPNEHIKHGIKCLVEGLAFNDGTGIGKVELSLDSGKTWAATALNPEIGRYSWRRWKYDWTPQSSGVYHLMVRATDTKGASQPYQQWNRSGYARGFIEQLDANVE